MTGGINMLYNYSTSDLTGLQDENVNIEVRKSFNVEMHKIAYFFFLP